MGDVGMRGGTGDSTRRPGGEGDEVHVDALAVTPAY